MTDENRDLQKSEFEALESIFREKKVDRQSDWDNLNKELTGSLKIDFDSIAGPLIEFRGLCFDERDEFSYMIKFLPPIKMTFQLPLEYPSSGSPKLDFSSYWMTTRQINVCKKAVEKVCAENEGMMVIYTCYQAVIDAMKELKIEFINLNRSDCHEKDETITVRWIRKQVLEELEEAKAEVFAHTNFNCNICWEKIKGSKCCKFEQCGHIFCRECVSGYYNSLMSTMINSPFKCLNPDCETEARVDLVKEVLGDELFEKYDDALLRRAIADMGATMVCPNQFCKQLAYVTDKDMKLVECASCRNKFCELCSETFHGVNPCKIRDGDIQKIMIVHNEGSIEDKVALYKRYGGEKRVTDLIHRMLTNQWVKEHTKACPRCRVPIEKKDGCNKMICRNCGSYMCWICELEIPNGYKHFEEGNCRGKLFQGMIPDSDDENDENDVDENVD